MSTGYHSGKEDRIHRTTSEDGTEIAGRVVGQGPPVVLLPAGPGTSEISWRHVVSTLQKRCTCYLMNTRNRGLSGESSDLSPKRLVEDVLAFVESIGQPVGLVGWGSNLWSSVAAEKSSALSGAAVYEPIAIEKQSEEIAAGFQDVVARVGQLTAQGQLVEGARTFVETAGELGVYADEDLEGAAFDFWEDAASDLPVFLQENQQSGESDMPSPTDPSVLAKISLPVLLMHGSRTGRWHVDSVQHVAEHLREPRIREIRGAGHFGPYTQAKAVADEIAGFFE